MAENLGKINDTQEFAGSPSSSQDELMSEVIKLWSGKAPDLIENQQRERPVWHSERDPREEERYSTESAGIRQRLFDSIRAPKSPLSGQFTDEDRKLVQQLQEAILNPARWDEQKHCYQLDPTKLVDTVQSILRGSGHGYDIIQALDATLAPYGIRAGLATGAVTLTFYDENFGLRRSMLINERGDPEVFWFNDEQRTMSHERPAEQATHRFFAKLQSTFVKPPAPHTWVQGDGGPLRR